MKTGLFDVNGREIMDGDFVSLDGYITTDDSMGHLPNGWSFDQADIYKVYWDERIKNPLKWGLDLGVEPDTPYNAKYMSHAVSLLHSGQCKVMEPKDVQEVLANLLENNPERIGDEDARNSVREVLSKAKGGPA